MLTFSPLLFSISPARLGFACCLERPAQSRFGDFRAKPLASIASKSIPAVLGFQGFCQVAAAEDESTSGFNIFVFLVPAGVIALLRWVFSLGPKMDEENAGYASTTLRGRDSEEKLQARIKAMEEQVKREELKTRMMMQGGPASQADLDELALLDDDLFSADLKRQLRAAQEK
eukprot:CAMPEP_0181502084 /NCGR_PEP_ID=MMETSP1110-20121109/56162_1 /TAXON_ID=174948 /ORGANISM="Symbiodinium sp., Strain CCMP421" /LENGTH=172 /DNA_ID=CAMNT_0023630631 /DNA_START=35 /DNA_END=554 /DNA_ORIENTATION=+